MSDYTNDEPTGDESTPAVHEHGGHGNGAAIKNGASPNGDASEFGTLRGLRENARVAMDALRDAGRGASAAVSELGDGAYQAGARTGARIARQVEAQPMTSVIVAASLGLIAGVLLARRSPDR
jgi:ElaB/YqjD/DUF883 family membrane-anchored ribosome-binding protein